MRSRLIASLILLAAILPFGAFAQQAAQYTQYFQNPFILNPAAAGMNDFLDLTMSYRKQWTNFNHSPETYYISVNKALSKNLTPDYKPLGLRISDPTVFNDAILDKDWKLRHGVGGYVMVDEYGAFTKSTINGAYAPHWTFDNGVRVSVGVSLGFSNLRFDKTKVEFIDPNDPTVLEFLKDNASTSFLDLNVGAFVYRDDFFGGYTTTQVLGNKLYFANPSNAQLELHHFFLGGYRMHLNDDVDLTPSIMVKFMSPAPVSFDVNLKADIRNMYWLGFSYRNKDSVSFLFGLKLKEMYRVAYSYDYTISPLSAYNNGSHELLLGIMLGK